MEIDETPNSQPADLLSWFDLTAEQFPWMEPRQQDIQSRRNSMSDKLFFDQLLEGGGISEAEPLYPPKHVAALRQLLDAIDGASYDSMKRDCLVYYLLKWHGDGRETRYADEKCISPQYISLADAYWHLDTGASLGKAIALLSDARIVKENSSKILETLSLSADAGPLILKYVRTCKPALTTSTDLQKYFLAIADSNLVEAWQFQKSFPDRNATRIDLIHKLLEWMLTPKPRSQALTQLLATPFSAYEETVVQDYAIHPPSGLNASSVTLIRDLVCVRLIQGCKYVDAVKFDRQFPTPVHNTKGTWSSERKRIIGDIISVMPPVERTMLENELEKLNQGPATASGSGSSWSNVSAGSGMGMSWEHIEPKTVSNVQGIAPKSNGIIAPTSGAPRRSSGTSRVQSLSVSNGLASSQNLFTPGASTSVTRQPPPSAQSTLVVHPPSQPQSSTPQLKLTSSAFSLPPPRQHSSPSQFGQLRPSHPTNHVNGVSAHKSNAFMTRNAFFEPPAADAPPAEGASRPSESQIFRPNEQQPSQLQSQAEGASTPLVGDGYAESDDELMLLGTSSEAMDQDDSYIDKEDLGYSLFGTATKHPKPPVETISKARAESEQRMPPGAFVPEPDDDRHIEPSHARTRTAQDPAPAPQPDVARKRTSRKRAASPEDRFRQSIPGTLFEEEEEEEVDEMAPLPPRPQRGTRKARSSRASSAEPEEDEPNRPVRRSSRLSATASPTDVKTPARPRKSTRTSGVGATATGRSATKKR